LTGKFDVDLLPGIRSTTNRNWNISLQNHVVGENPGNGDFSLN
jgi:hypothetical protein